MVREILMPALSPTMEKGKVGRWVKKEGDSIKSGDIIAEIETDKAIMEWEATEEGILGKIIVEEGTEDVEVNKVIGLLMEEGESKEEVEKYAKNMGEVKENTPEVSSSQPQPNPISAPVSNINETVVSSSKSSRVFITPLAKRIANQNNIDISLLKGSGPSGRIIKHDVETAIKSGVSLTHSSPANLQSPENLYEDRPNPGIRKVIAKRLLESKITIPHYYITLEIDVDTLLQSRQSLNSSAEGKFKLSVNDFIIKAVALALQDRPECNASWMGETTRYYTNSDVAVAVATETGLFTPIIKSAQKKGLVEISNEMKSLAKKAKEGKLMPEDYQGGSFSISNLGMYGVKEFNAIINPPHAGILAVGGTSQKPVVKNGQIVIGNVMNITLSADHRVLDGAVGAIFLNTIKKYLEHPLNMIL